MSIFDDDGLYGYSVTDDVRAVVHNVHIETLPL